MRTLVNVKLLERIRENPHHFIGQPNFDLFQAFMLPIDSGTELSFSEGLTPTLESMPSMREFVSEKLNLEIPSAVRWTWAIGFTVEDQRALLDSYFDWVFDYETQFPFATDNYNFIFNEKRMRIIELLKHIRLRPGMFGISGLAGIRAMIDGEFYLLEYYNRELSENEKKVFEFVQYWRSKTDSSLPFDTWDRPLGKERLGINPFNFNGDSGKWEIERFVQILEEEAGVVLSEPEIRR